MKKTNVKEFNRKRKLKTGSPKSAKSSTMISCVACELQGSLQHRYMYVTHRSLDHFGEDLYSQVL